MSDTARPALHLDDSVITWRPLSGYEGLSMWVLGVNDVRHQVNILFRLAPGARCPAHRHVGPTDTFVLGGEHRTHALESGTWRLDQVRPPGFFAANEGDHLHFEEGGAEGAIVQLSMTAVDGVIWEVLDDDANVIATTTIDDFRRVLQRQQPVPAHV